MTREEYLAAIDACHNGESYPGDPNDWNKDYRANLEKHGLMLTYAEPKEPWYLMAPDPTPQPGDYRNPIPHTPETDPSAWNMPAWIIDKA